MGFWLLASITFFSAFLLFQIELIIAKMFLPAYGGSYLVWGACVVFFQAALLGGYVFAHFLIQRFQLQRYLKIHLALLLLPFLVFPGRPVEIAAQATGIPLVMDVFLRLLTTIGPVFFALSTASLVTQSWLHASRISQRAYPYILYAISNVGSFLALWSYPFIFEYFLTSTEQMNIWRGLYVALVIMNLAALKFVPVGAQPQAATPAENAPGGQTRVTRGVMIRWLVLSAGSVMLFLSVTNLITYEVAPIPLLWIMPLSIYLLSFVLNFKAVPWFPSWLRILVPLAFLTAVLFQAKTFLPAAWAIIFYNFSLFVLCMYAQNELIRTRPSTSQLTLFYVIISFGGFVGGFLTSWVIPLISTTTIELLVALALIMVTYPNKIMRMIFMIILALTPVLNYMYKPHKSLHVKRNYYGIYDIYDKDNVRSFLHGTTLHGLEWTDHRRFIPLGYYSPNTPLNDVFSRDYFSARRVGAVGLGAGTMAMFSKPDMSMDFYELDPDVLEIAKDYFWYLSLSPGPVRVAVGDARISLAAAPEVVYDVLVIDAFGGDSIPFHLINKDVISLYRQRMDPRGGLLFHISNRYFSLEPVLANIAAATGANAALKEAKQDGLTLQTFWVVLTWDRERFDRMVKEGWQPLKPEDFKPMRTWADNYSTVLPILRLKDMWDALVYYRFQTR